MERPKISIYISSSIDGFIAREDGSLDWLDSVGGSDEDYGFKRFLTGIDAVIMGRKTYEVASSAYGTTMWPYTGKKMFILSQTLQNVIPEAELFSGDIGRLLQRLHVEGVGTIWIDGGKTISQFLRLGLVDEMILSIIPHLLGSGIPLFTIGKEMPCQLLSARSYPSGLVQMHYALTKE